MPKHPQADIALLTDRRYTAATAAADDWYLRNILHDDALLQNALAKFGLSSVRVDWADPDADWPSFRCAVFRTTWDYYERISEFTSWLKHTATKVRLCNDPSIIWWNLDKRYLADLQNRGIPTVPSRYITPGGCLSLPDLLEDTGWDEAVVKPCISAGAYHTWRIRRDNAAEVQAALQPMLEKNTFIIQPFLHDILHSGEDTLMIIDGRFTHAIKKRPKPGDFRVQDDYGGTVHPLRPDPEQIRLAERAMAACDAGLPNKPGYADELPSEKTSGHNPAYGRVDMARDNDGQWVVMELELIEPELWLREEPSSAEIFAAAIARMIS